jgi:hypothetical protein
LASCSTNFSMVVSTGNPPYQAKSVEQVRDEQKTRDIEISPHVSNEARDLILRIVQLNPDDRPDINAIINHPALLPYHTPTPLTAEEYQIMLRNYMLNTQGSNNRNLPEEIEKFMQTYTDNPQSTPESANEKLIVSYSEFNSAEKQPSIEADKFDNQKNLKSPTKENFFDDISKVIQMENSSTKANIFRKASAPRNVISELIFNEELQQNQKVEKLTNFFAAMYEPFTNQPNVVVPAAQFIDDPKLAKFAKSPTPNYVEENNQFMESIPTSEENTTIMSPTVNLVIRAKSPPVTHDVITRIEKVDLNDFSSGNERTTTSQGSNNDSTSKLRTSHLKYFSSDSNDLFESKNFSKVKKDNTFVNIDRFTTDSNITSWQETVSNSETIGEQYRQPKLIVSSLINRSVFSTHNAGDSAQNKTIVEPVISTHTQVLSPLNQSIKTSTINRSEETNSINHLPITRTSETKRKSSASIEPMQFINAPLDKFPQSQTQTTGKTTEKTNERLTHDSGNTSSKTIHIKLAANNQQDYSTSSFNNMGIQSKEIQKISEHSSPVQINNVSSIQTTFENINLKSSQAFYQYSEPKSMISANFKSIKYPNSEIATEKETKSKAYLSTEPSHFNKSNSMHALVHDLKTKKVNGGDFRHGDRMFLPLEVKADTKISSILPNMTTLHREIYSGTNTVANSNRSTVNAFVNHNDEEHAKYLQTLNYFSSARNVSQPLKQFDIDSLLDTAPHSDSSGRRASEMNSNSRTSLFVSKPPLQFNSKIIKLPATNQLSRKDK